MFLNEHQFPSLNQVINDSKLHWSVYHSQKKLHTLIVKTEAKRLWCGRPPISEKVVVRCDWQYPRSKGRGKDPDNISFAIKYLLDGLVAAGVIPDDGPAQIESIHHYFAYHKEKGYGVTITLYGL